MDAERNKRIKQALDEAGITQQMLAQQLGVRQATISDRLNRREVDSIDFVLQVSKLTKRSFAWLACLEEEPPAPVNIRKDVSGNDVIRDHEIIPIMDLNMAASNGGYENSDHVLPEDTILIPSHMLKTGQHVWGRIKGPSMSPTFQDSGYVCVRHVEPSNWENLREEYVHLIITREGHAYLKRIKNRLRQHGHLTLMSDNPDKASYGNFDVKLNDIHHVWEAEWYLTNRFPNIHKQYYQRVQDLEETVTRHEYELEAVIRRVKILNVNINK